MSWYNEIKNAVTDTTELLGILQLHKLQPRINVDAYPLFVPLKFIARMQKQSTCDPLLLQVLPLACERQIVPGFVHDPLGEKDANPVPGLLHKYHGRALITVSNLCALNCRFCFRRHYKFKSNLFSHNNAQKIFNYLADNDTIKEVILSGGEPLFISDQRLEYIYRELEKIAHIKTVRIHTRLPIVIPSRITAQFINIVANSKLKTVLVTHCNHANEIDAEVMLAIEKLRANIVLLNQSVLLKDINDNVTALKMLSEKLFTAGIMPYYLHMLDKVAGASHFAVDEKDAIALMHELEQKLPGYLVPRLVREDKSKLAKTRIV